MSDPSYPSRRLDREWRVAYKRRARHLAVIFTLAFAACIAAAWSVVAAHRGG